MIGRLDMKTLTSSRFLLLFSWMGEKEKVKKLRLEDELYLLQLLPFISNLPNLEDMCIAKQQCHLFSDIFFRSIAESCQNLRKLEADFTCSDETLEYFLAKCTKLEELVLITKEGRTRTFSEKKGLMNKIVGVKSSEEYFLNSDQLSPSLNVLSLDVFCGLARNLKSLTTGLTGTDNHSLFRGIAENCPHFEELFINSDYRYFKAKTLISVNSLIYMAEKCPKFPTSLHLETFQGFIEEEEDKVIVFTKAFYCRLVSLTIYLDGSCQSFVDFADVTHCDPQKIEKIKLECTFPLPNAKYFLQVIEGFSKLKELSGNIFYMSEVQMDGKVQVKSKSLEKIDFTFDSAELAVHIHCPNLKEFEPEKKIVEGRIIFEEIPHKLWRKKMFLDQVSQVKEIKKFNPHKVILSEADNTNTELLRKFASPFFYKIKNF